MRTYENPGLEMTQEEVAAHLGVSRAYVSQVEQRAMRKLRRLVLELSDSGKLDGRSRVFWGLS